MQYPNLSPKGALEVRVSHHSSAKPALKGQPTYLPAKKQKMESWFRLDDENTRLLLEEIEELEKAFIDLAFFEEREINLDSIQHRVLRHYKNIARGFYAKISSTSKLSAAVYQRRNVSYSSNESYLKHLLSNTKLYGISDEKYLSWLLKIRGIRTFLDHPTKLSSTYDWMTHSFISKKKSFSALVFFGYGHNPDSTGLEVLNKFFPYYDKDMTFPIKADWYIAMPPPSVLRDSLATINKVREFLINKDEEANNE